MDKIQRKSLLYKTGVEYGDWAINFLEGCSHGCTYCYAFKMAKRFKKTTYEEWCKPKLVENAYEILSSELWSYNWKNRRGLCDRIDNVTMCFSTDPFMLCDPKDRKEVYDMAIRLMGLFSYYHIKVRILTKGQLPSDPMGKYSDWEYGISLSSLSSEFKEKYEPHAMDPYMRILELKNLHEQGYKTWVSMEPYPTPNIVKQDINEILEKIKFVDKIVFGRWHYDKQISSYKETWNMPDGDKFKFNAKNFYNREARAVKMFCAMNNIECIIKKGTYTSGESNTTTTIRPETLA